MIHLGNKNLKHSMPYTAARMVEIGKAVTPQVELPTLLVSIYDGTAALGKVL